MSRHRLAWFTQEEVDRISRQASHDAHAALCDGLHRAKAAEAFGALDGPPADVIPLRPTCSECLETASDCRCHLREDAFTSMTGRDSDGA